MFTSGLGLSGLQNASSSMTRRSSDGGSPTKRVCIEQVGIDQAVHTYQHAISNLGSVSLRLESLGIRSNQDIQTLSFENCAEALKVIALTSKMNLSPASVHTVIEIKNRLLSLLEEGKRVPMDVLVQLPSCMNSFKEFPSFYSVFNDERFLGRFAEEITSERFDQFDSLDDLIHLVQLYSNFQYQDEAFFDRIANYLSQDRIVGNFSIRELADIALTFCVLNTKYEYLFSQIAKNTTSAKLKEAPAKDFANLAKAYRIINIEDKLLFERIAAASTVDKLRELSISQLADLAFSFMRLQIDNLDFFNRIAVVLTQEALNSADGKELSMLASSFSAGNIRNGDLFDRIARATSLEKLKESQADCVTTIANSFANLRVRNTSLFKRIAEVATLDWLQDTSMLNIATLAVAYGILNIENKPLFELISEASTEEKLNSTSPQNLLMLAHAFSKLLLRDVYLFIRINKAMTEEKKARLSAEEADLFHRAISWQNLGQEAKLSHLGQQSRDACLRLPEAAVGFNESKAYMPISSMGNQEESIDELRKQIATLRSYVLHSRPEDLFPAREWSTCLINVHRLELDDCLKLLGIVNLLTNRGLAVIGAPIVESLKERIVDLLQSSERIEGRTLITMVLIISETAQMSAYSHVFKDANFLNRLISFANDENLKHVRADILVNLLEALHLLEFHDDAFFALAMRAITRDEVMDLPIGSLAGLAYFVRQHQNISTENTEQCVRILNWVAESITDQKLQNSISKDLIQLAVVFETHEAAQPPLFEFIARAATPEKLKKLSLPELMDFFRIFEQREYINQELINQIKDEIKTRVMNNPSYSIILETMTGLNSARVFDADLIEFIASKVTDPLLEQSDVCDLLLLAEALRDAKRRESRLFEHSDIFARIAQNFTFNKLKTDALIEDLFNLTKIYYSINFPDLSFFERISEAMLEVLTNGLSEEDDLSEETAQELIFMFTSLNIKKDLLFDELLKDKNV